MIILVTTEEAEGLRYACAQNTLDYTVLDNSTPGLVKVGITDSGKNISAALAYRLKGVADQYVRERKASDEYGRMLAQELGSNNVVVLVEDLPR